MSTQPSSKVLSPGELSIGQHITVLAWAPVTHSPALSSLFGFGDGTTATATADQSYCGDVLEVKAVDLPYIVVDRVAGYACTGIDLDTRRVTLMELSPAYVAAKMAKQRSSTTS